MIKKIQTDVSGERLETINNILNILESKGQKVARDSYKNYLRYSSVYDCFSPMFSENEGYTTVSIDEFKKLLEEWQ